MTVPPVDQVVAEMRREMELPQEEVELLGKVTQEAVLRFLLYLVIPPAVVVAQVVQEPLDPLEPLLPVVLVFLVVLMEQQLIVAEVVVVGHI